MIRREPSEDSIRDIRIAARMTRAQRKEIMELCKKIRVNDSAFVRMSAKMVHDGMENGDIDVETFIHRYESIT